MLRIDILLAVGAFIICGWVWLSTIGRSSKMTIPINDNQKWR